MIGLPLSAIFIALFDELLTLLPINNFLKEADLLANKANKEKYGYSAKAGSAIVFDEGGVHKGSRPRSKDRMVLRYLYSPSNKIK